MNAMIIDRSINLGEFFVGNGLPKDPVTLKGEAMLLILLVP